MKKLSGIIWCVILFLLAFYILGCSEIRDKNDVRKLTDITFIDGQTIKVPTVIKTYATLSPSYTETLIDLGFEENIVTVDMDSTYLSVYDSDVTIFDTEKIDLNHKDLLENSPDVILIESKVFNKFTEAEVAEIVKNGSCFIVLPEVKSIADVRDELDFIVRLTKAKYGEKLLEDFDAKFAHILAWKSRVNELPVVFLQLVDKSNVKTVGSDTLLNEMISLAGGYNTFSDKKGEYYTEYSEIANRNPNYYFAISSGETTQLNQILNNSNLIDTIAIQNEEVYIFDEIQMFNPNYRCLDAINTMGYILHRDIYK